eukprot:COSAG02_NODE_6179_length_3748_cov_786.322849_2_plen_176_part_00
MAMSGSEHVSPEAGKKRSRDDLTGLSSEEKRQRRCVRTRGASLFSASIIPACAARIVRTCFIFLLVYRLEQNRLAAKRSYTKRVAKQSADHEKLDKIDAELEELRQMVKVQKSQIDTMGQIIAQLQGVPDGAKIQPQMNAAFSSNAAAQAQSSLASAGLSANETKRASGSGGARG